MKRNITFILFIFSLITHAQSIVYFADVNFKNAVIAEGVDTNNNGQIEVTEAEAVSMLSVNDANITDLTGIGSFTNLMTLNVYNNNLTSLNLHNNTNLITINAASCGSLAGNVNLSGLSNLTNLDIYNNGLTSIDLSDLSNLSNLKISTNSLSELNLQNNTLLTTLEAIGAGDFNSINFSTNTLLSTIRIGNNNLYTLDLSTNSELRFLYCNDNHLSSLNVSDKLDLETVQCQNNDLVNLILKNIEDGGYPFDYLDCSGNDYLTCIMVDDPATFNPATEILPPDAEYNITCEEQVYIEDQWFEFKLIDQGIDTGNGGVIDHKVSKISVFFLENLDINIGIGANITSIRGIEAFEALKTFTAHENSITKADFTKNTALENIRLDDNALTEINVTTLVNLKGLRLKNNNLTEIDITHNTLLENLDVNGNYLSSLNVTQNTALTSLYALNNTISTINLYNNEALTIVNLDNNELSILSVNNHPNLVSLHCADNNLNILNLSPNTVNLENLYCDNNQLSNNNITIPNSEELKIIIANDNLFNDIMDFNTCINLNELNLANNTGIEEIAIRNGNNTSMTLFDATGCTSLDTVCVDDASVAPTISGWSVDDTSVYSTCAIVITDANFEQALIDLGIDTYDNPSSPGAPNGYIDENDPVEVTYLNINNKNISNLSGINFFTDLEALIVYGNNLSGIDVSALSNLRTLNLKGNNLDSYYMTLPNPTDLRNLYIDNNQEFYGGNSLDDVIGNQTLLEKLTLADNNAHSLELTNFPNLLEVNCSNNPDINELDVSNSPLLKRVIATGCSITNLNVNSINSLDEIQVQSNNMTSLTLGNQPHLNSLRCFNNELTNLDISAIPTLGFLACGDNPLNELDVSSNHELGYLGISNSPNLLFLNLRNGNNTTTLNEVYATDLGIDCCIQVDDETNVPTAWILDSTDTTISNDCTPDYTYVPDNNFENALKGMGYDDTIDDYVLTANINTITTLDISGLNIADLTGIEDFSALEELYISNNSLGNIDLYNNTELTLLNCENNNLSSLDMSNNTALSSLVCSLNNIADLDLSSNLNLISINCSNNNLTELRIQNGNNTSIPNGEFNATGNPNLSCIFVDDSSWSESNWSNIDSTTHFVETSAECDAVVLSISSEALETGVYLYPNPVTDLLTINVSNSIQLASIILYDITGKPINVSSQQNRISLHHLSPGIYFIKIQDTEGNNITRKVIKN